MTNSGSSPRKRSSTFFPADGSNTLFAKTARGHWSLPGRTTSRRGVKLYAHTSNDCFRINQQPIPCRLREAAFALDGLLEHDTELDPRVCYTDTHGYTEVVMATAALLGFDLSWPKNQGYQAWVHASPKHAGVYLRRQAIVFRPLLDSA